VDYFVETVLPKLSSLAEGELWALAGMFLDRHMPTARVIAAYARAVGHLASTGTRPNTGQFWDEWRAQEKWLSTPPDELVPF
jgi:hypothetical protein